MLSSPRLPDMWHFNVRTGGFVQREYQNKSWTDTEVAGVVVGASTGAIGAAPGGPATAAAVGVGTGAVLAAGVEINHWLNADMRPRYYHGNWGNNYDSTYNHYPSAR